MRSLLTFSNRLQPAARLQVHEQAKFIDKSYQAYEGRVSRNIVTGGYQIDSPTFRSSRKSKLTGMSSDGLLWQSTVTLYGQAPDAVALRLSFPGAAGRRHTAQA
jgi:hypothetical protein